MTIKTNKHISKQNTTQWNMLRNQQRKRERFPIEAVPQSNHIPAEESPLFIEVSLVD